MLSNKISNYPLTVAATALSYGFYGAITFFTENQREKEKIDSPKVVGTEEFNCLQRIQANTLENITVAIPSFWMLSLASKNDMYGGLAGFSWLLGRIIYWQGYPKNHYPGWIITVLSQTSAFVGGAYLALSEYFETKK